MEDCQEISECQDKEIALKAIPKWGKIVYLQRNKNQIGRLTIRKMRC